MLVTLRQRNFALILAGSFISLIGDWMLLVGLPLRVYTLTHSTLSTSITFMVGALPALLVGQLAGVFVDRWNRKHILIVANLLLALNLLPLLLVTSARDVWIVYLVQFVAALVGQFLQPAAGAMLPTLVAEELLVPANALNGLSMNLARLIGPSLGGAIVAFLGLQGIALLDAVSFLVAGAMASLVILPSHSKAISSTGGEASSVWQSVWGDLVDGMLIIRSERVLWVMVLTFAILGIGEGVFIALLVPFVTGTLHGTGRDYGLFLGLQAVGGLIGGLLVGQFGKRASQIALAGLGTIGLGIADFAIFNYVWLVPALSGVLPALALIVVAGVPAAASGVGGQTLIQRATSDTYRGRVLAVVGVVLTIFELIGSATAGLLGDHLGVIPVLNIHACTLVLAGVLTILLLRGRDIG